MVIKCIASNIIQFIAIGILHLKLTRLVTFVEHACECVPEYAHALGVYCIIMAWCIDLYSDAVAKTTAPNRWLMEMREGGRIRGNFSVQT